MDNNSITDEHLNHMLDLVKSTEEVDVLKDTCEWLINELVKQDVTEQNQAEPREQTEDRQTYRNGFRERMLKTRVGSLELKIPELRGGTYYPEGLLERQQPAEQAIISTVMQAYINGVSTRKVTELVEEMGLEGMGKVEVTRINKQLDGKVRQFQKRRFSCRYPYVFLDGTVTRVREDGQVLNTAMVVAVGVSETGHREILGFDVGGTENEEFWMKFLRGPKQRGLKGTRLIISDAHVGLRNAINTVFTGPAWQRCLAHYKNYLAVHVSTTPEDEAKDWIDSIVNASNKKEARHQIERAKDWFEDHDARRAAKKLQEDQDDILAHMQLPKVHWKRLRRSLRWSD